jgi:UTP:GlnB (protein PII) uridylyltransferase
MRGAVLITVCAMPKMRLSEHQIQEANSLLDHVRARLTELSQGDQELLFALRRRIYIRLGYDERGTPQHRTKLKNQKWKEQAERGYS